MRRSTYSRTEYRKSAAHVAQSPATLVTKRENVCHELVAHVAHGGAEAKNARNTAEYGPRSAGNGCITANNSV